MSNISQETGRRIRSLRQQEGFTQELLAEKAELHPVYIGQVERGEKNLTLNSLAKILAALHVTFSDFFEGIEPSQSLSSTAYRCYELVRQYPPAEQERLYRILTEIDTLSKDKK